MTYDAFKQEMISALRSRLGSNFEISTKEILKNNNLKLDGLIINDSSINISPTIYLNYYYDMYEKGMSIDDVSDKILSCYDKYRMSESLDTSFFDSFDTIKDNVVYKLVNFDKNRDLLEQIPFIPYLDLAIVFYYYFPETYTISQDGETVHGSILIYNQHIEQWGVSVKELLKYAKRNTPRLLPPEVKPLYQIVVDLLVSHNPDCPLPEDSDIPLYMMSNINHVNGASSVLYQGILQEWADKLDSDLYVIPSSIHEVLFLPSSEGMTCDYLTDMVRTVNENEVATEEVLADHIYYFNRDIGSLTEAV